MIYVKSRFPGWIGAGAFTVCPFIFIDPKYAMNWQLRTHEKKHWWQQFWFGVVGAVVGMLAWCVMGWPLQPLTIALAAMGLVEGWVLGQLLWRFLYLAVLPVWWNPFRRKWETDAYLAHGVAPERIDEILTRKPYCLRW